VKVTGSVGAKLGEKEFKIPKVGVNQNTEASSDFQSE